MRVRGPVLASRLDESGDPWEHVRQLYRPWLRDIVLVFPALGVVTGVLYLLGVPR